MNESCKLKHPQGSERGTCKCVTPNDCEYENRTQRIQGFEEAKDIAKGINLHDPVKVRVVDPLTFDEGEG